MNNSLNVNNKKKKKKNGVFDSDQIRGMLILGDICWIKYYADSLRDQIPTRDT